MPAVNRVLMLGNLTRDPQLSYTPNQTAVADFGLAVNRKWQGQDGAKRESVCFIDVRAFGTTAENVNKYLHKGNLVFIEGHLDFEKWDQDGQPRSKHRLTVESVQFMPQGKSKTDTPAQGGEPVRDPDIPF